MELSLDRRAFVAAAATTAIAGAVAGAVVAPAPAAADEADHGEADPDEASYDPFVGHGSDPIAPVEPPASWDYEADVIMVGTGGATLNAAAYCADAGLSVVAIDKNGFVGGTIIEATAWIGAGSKLVPFDPNDVAATAYYGASVDECVSKFEPCDRDFMRAIIEGNGEAMDWMVEKQGCSWVRERTGEIYSGYGTTETGGEDSGYGLTIIWDGEFPDNIQSAIGLAPGRAMLPAGRYMEQACRDKGVEFVLQTKATALVMDEGRVVGVQAVNDAGETVYLRGDKAVLLATGGFSNNPDMIARWCPTAGRGVVACATMFYHTGEGQRMAEGAGADFTGFDTFMCYDGGLDYHGTKTGPFYHYMNSGDSCLVRAQWLTINKQGKRFMKTYTGSEPSFGEAMAIMQQPGHRAYVIFDGDYQENIFKTDPMGSGMPRTPDQLRVDAIPDGICSVNWLDDVQKALDADLIKHADTLEELAEKLGLEPENLVGAVEDWNACCEAGEDPEWGEPAKVLIPIAQPPFYGAEVGGWIWSTACGVRVSPDMEALDADGKPIPGLFAAGSTIGGSKGYANANVAGPLEGAAQSWTTGYMAGRKIVADAQA